jgi:phospholipid/cholesterol/gamma-HCH transport system permease protein
VLPKVVATTVLSPLLMLLSLALGLVGGWFVVEFTQIIPPPSYITGIKAFWNGFYVFYSCFKMSLFCFMISSIAAFNGYYAKGGSLGVGKSSTKAIVITSILILLSDLVVTQLMLY